MVAAEPQIKNTEYSANAYDLNVKTVVLKVDNFVNDASIPNDFHALSTSHWNPSSVAQWNGTKMDVITIDGVIDTADSSAAPNMTLANLIGIVKTKLTGTNYIQFNDPNITGGDWVYVKIKSCNITKNTDKRSVAGPKDYFLLEYTLELVVTKDST